MLQVPRLGLWMARAKSWIYSTHQEPSSRPSTATRMQAAGIATGRARAPRRLKIASSASSTSPTLASQTTSWFHAAGGVDEPPSTQWREKRLVLDGRHPGCVERRDPSSKDFHYLHPGGVCEFDGRLSLVVYGAQVELHHTWHP